jgi:hypothetical protein
MDFTLIATVFGAIAVLSAIIGSLIKQSSGSSLNKKFVALGNMTGMTLSQISARVGSPNSITQFPDGEKLCQWAASGFAIGIIFDGNNVCVRLAHQDSF